MMPYLIIYGAQLILTVLLIDRYFAERDLTTLSPRVQRKVVQFTIQQADPHPMTGRPIPPYVQIETQTNDGRGEPLTDAERAQYPTPEQVLATGLPTGRYTLAPVMAAIRSTKRPIRFRRFQAI